MYSKTEEFQKVVDLDKIIEESNNKFFKTLPRFCVNFMKRVLRQDELNRIHNRYKDKTGIDYINDVITELNIEIRTHNTEAVKKDRRYVFVANHPLGGIDAISFLSCIHKFLGDVVSPSNEFFNYIPNLRPLIVGVNVFGQNNKQKAEAVAKAFDSDAHIMIFPAGKVSRKKKGLIRDVEWHKTFISKGVQNKRDVVPVFISGSNSKKFYRIEKLRKILGIKLPVETFYLPQEMLKKRGYKIDLVFSKPIPYTYFDNSKTPHQWAQYVREMVYDTGKNTLSKKQGCELDKVNLFV